MRFKNLLLIFIVFAFAFAFAKPLAAQDFQGIATYKTRRQIDIKMDSTQMNDEMQKRLQEQLKKQFQKEFILQFNRNESVYKENEKLDAPQVGNSSGIQIKISAGNSILYKNTQAGTFTKQDELLGKMFVIQDSLPKIEWTLEKEQKSIGAYTCFKATFTREVKERQWGSSSDSISETIANKTVTVWYTPQIPLSNGPEEYWGLPGLILEVQDDKLSILCSSIVLNPQEKLEIEAPDKGKIVDQKTFNALQEEKMKEWVDRNSSNKKGDGKQIMIKIGG
tara:strand:- start:394 stop:1230 length:837 start_codon:yes stop_codon:yes gene_type:complete